MKEIMFLPMSVCLFDFSLAYLKSYERIVMKFLEGCVRRGSRKNQLYFGGVRIAIRIRGSSITVWIWEFIFFKELLFTIAM